MALHSRVGLQHVLSYSPNMLKKYVKDFLRGEKRTCSMSCNTTTSTKCRTSSINLQSTAKQSNWVSVVCIFFWALLHPSSLLSYHPDLRIFWGHAPRSEKETSRPPDEFIKHGWKTSALRGDL